MFGCNPLTFLLPLASSPVLIKPYPVKQRMVSQYRTAHFNASALYRLKTCSFLILINNGTFPPQTQDKSLHILKLIFNNNS